MTNVRFLAVAVSLLVGCAEGVPTPLSWEEFEAGAVRDVNGGYIVNGDEPAPNVESLRAYYDEYMAAWEAANAEVAVATNPLTVNVVGGKWDVYDASRKLNLTYCVSRQSFGANYDRVVREMAAAAGAWEAAANLNFTHLVDQDGNCTASNPNVWFDVNQVTGQQYVARAFFPSSGRAERNVLIDTQAYGNMGVWTLTGVLRHELGHTLGWRHEHARWESWSIFAGCFESLFGGFAAVNAYDAKSVMHYPQCNGKQTGDLVLTQGDIAGAQSVYGAPQ